MIYRTRILTFNSEFDEEGTIEEIAINLANVCFFQPSEVNGFVKVTFSSGDTIEICETFEKFCTLMGIKQAVYDN